MTVKSREESSNVTYAEEPSTKKKKKNFTKAARNTHSFILITLR